MGWISNLWLLTKVIVLDQPRGKYSCESPLWLIKLRIKWWLPGGLCPSCGRLKAELNQVYQNILYESQLWIKLRIKWWQPGAGCQGLQCPSCSRLKAEEAKIPMAWVYPAVWLLVCLVTPPTHPPTRKPYFYYIVAQACALVVVVTRKPYYYYNVIPL